jgi:5-methyltetrahydropteroyltriglutamate--homocysteine methyltransferase
MGRISPRSGGGLLNEWSSLVKEGWRSNAKEECSSRRSLGRNLPHSLRVPNWRAENFGNDYETEDHDVKRSTDRILTTHVGSLPRPADLMALYAADAPDEKLKPCLRAAVGEIVRQQADSGIDVVNDGEFGKAMRSSMDFGAWWSYVYPRLERYELSEEQAKKGRAAWTYGSKERKEFAEFYAAEASAAASAAPQSGSSTAQLYGLTCTSPVKYVGHAAIKRDTENLAAAVRTTRVADAFMTAVSPATLQILPNAYYKSAEDYTWALAEAIREEYRAIVDALFCRSTPRRWSTCTTGGSR